MLSLKAKDVLEDSADWTLRKKAIDEGLAVDNLSILKEKYKFTDESLAKLLGVSTRTIFRRKSGNLNSEESAKIYLLLKVLKKSEGLMGTPENVIEWMNLPNPGLKNYTPLELSTNIIGHEEIMNLLNKMEWGIF